MPVIPTTKPLEKRHDKDNYITPEGVALTHVLQVIKIIDTYINQSDFPSYILDLGCGTGIYGYSARHFFPKAHITGIDIRSKEQIADDDDPNLIRNHSCYNKIYFNSAEIPPTGFYDLIIGNPPFNIAEKLIREAMTFLSDGGILSLLLRSNFLESKGRFNGLYKEFPLFKYDFLIDRIPWQNHTQGAKGKSDYETYALYHWCVDYILMSPANRDFTKLELVSWKNMVNSGAFVK